MLGTFIAPEGVVQLDKEVFFKGAICAKEIEVKKDVTFVPYLGEAAGLDPVEIKTAGQQSGE